MSRWLSGEGRATLDVLTREALDVIAILDRDLTLRYINWTAAGLKREDVVDHNVLELSPPNARELAFDTYTKVLQTGVGARFETLYRGETGVLMWDVRVGPIHFEGEIIGLIVITNDVTEQRSAQTDRDRFFSLSLDMLIVVSPTTLLKRVNPAFGEALGYDPTELLDVPFLNFVHPDDRARTLEVFEGLLHGKPAPPDFENRYRRRDGEHRYFSWRATADPVTGVVYAVARDVTDHRAMETQLRHAQKMEAVGQLAGGIAHDFNNLLQAVLANAELGLQGAPPADLAECLREIEDAGRRAADLTKQLLAFSRGQPLRPVPIDLNDLIGGLLKMLRRLIPESIVVELVPGHDLASVNADPSQLEQVIVNLCVNARDAMEQGGQLTIETENAVLNSRFCELHPWARAGRYVLLSVTDTGVGMTPGVQERIFEPFFTTKPAHQGTGLGLATVYGIVQQHDGLIQVDSEPGKGSSFEIYLPAGGGLATGVDTKVTALLPPRGQETILLAEDEEQVRRVAVQILQRAGYRTIAAANGVEAVRLLRELEEPVHLALLDVVMPELGGPETWEQMRGLRQGLGLRVLFTSGYADQRYRKRLPPGAEVLEKPFRTEELLRRVRRALDG
ncbi:MAG TPA: ATP-binding protein [Polyangiaceae bacterium]|nr:ATP-binding protein [Polyangiaceae bacterium]